MQAVIANVYHGHFVLTIDDGDERTIVTLTPDLRELYRGPELGDAIKVAKVAYKLAQAKTLAEEAAAIQKE